MALRRGDPFPSVTEVLELAGLVDLSMIPKSTLENAKRRGQEVHAWTEALDTGQLVGVEPPAEIRGYVQGYEKFKADVGFYPEEIELPVRNEQHGYDGTLDRIGPIHGRRSLVDIKCVYQIHHTTALQTAGYQLCLPERIERYALQLKGDGTYDLPPPHRDRQDTHDFLAAVRMAHYKLRHRGELPWLAP